MTSDGTCVRIWFCLVPFLSVTRRGTVDVTWNFVYNCTHARFFRCVWIPLETSSAYVEFWLVFSKQIVWACTYFRASIELRHDVVARLRRWRNVRHVCIPCRICAVVARVRLWRVVHHVFMPVSSCDLFVFDVISPVHIGGLGSAWPEVGAHVWGSSFRLLSSVGKL